MPSMSSIAAKVRRAIAENRIEISKDEDFFILATRPGDFGRLLWLRVGN